MKRDWAALFGLYLGKLLVLATRAFVIMFVAAVVYKRFGVLAPWGYVESLAWAAGYGLVRGLLHKDEDDTSTRS